MGAVLLKNTLCASRGRFVGEQERCGQFSYPKIMGCDLKIILFSLNTGVENGPFSKNHHSQITNKNTQAHIQREKQDNPYNR